MRIPDGEYRALYQQLNELRDRYERLRAAVVQVLDVEVGHDADGMRRMLTQELDGEGLDRETAAPRPSSGTAPESRPGDVLVAVHCALALLVADIPCNAGCGCEEYDYCAEDEGNRALRLFAPIAFAEDLA